MILRSMIVYDYILSVYFCYAIDLVGAGVSIKIWLNISLLDDGDCNEAIHCMQVKNDELQTHRFHLESHSWTIIPKWMKIFSYASQPNNESFMLFTKTFQYPRCEVIQIAHVEEAYKSHYIPITFVYQIPIGIHSVYSIMISVHLIGGQRAVQCVFP